MKLTKIYGASDDLIEVEGAVEEEHGCYGHKKPIKIEVSDGTLGNIFYAGQWKINVSFAGDLYQELIESVGDDGKHVGNAECCSSYSDVLIMRPGVDWVKIGSRVYRR